MNLVQPAILAEVPDTARALTFALRGGADPRPGLRALCVLPELEGGVIGLGEPLVLALHAQVPGLRSFPAVTGPGSAFPSTQGALWVLLRGGDRGLLLHRSLRVTGALGPDYYLLEDVDCFRHREGRDLTGFEDGTENPKGDAATAAAIVAGQGEGMDGSSFVAVQRWAHDLARFTARPQAERDHVIGRRLSDNEELPDAPPAAHVKRSAQESYDPPAFMLRRSMPWIEGREQGLLFVAFGESLDRFERVLRRMAGLDDGVPDALLTFSHARTGGYYWCPPMRGACPDLRQVGLSR